MRYLRTVVDCQPSLFSYCKTRVFARRLKDIKKWFSTSYYVLSDNEDQFDLSKFPPETIRNFSIVAHVDHGKSTLADRILEITGTISKTSDNKQVLDKLQVERERGITVKAQTASLFYKHNGQNYLLNLIDTPGHVDFSYEVSRSLSACQGVVLLVDAAQGVQAQTVSNYFLATGANLAVIPVLNKIDLKNAKPHEVSLQLEKLFNMDPNDILKVSAKEGVGVEQLLQAIVDKLPSPQTCAVDKPMSALLFDSWYDQYRGVICLIAVLNGCIMKGDKVKSVHSGQTYEVSDIGIMHPNECPTNSLYAGQVGYLVTGMRNRRDALIGDTFCHVNSNVAQYPGFKPAMPMVFAGVYPVDMSQYVTLRNAIEKLTLNDSSVTIHPDSCIALGQGWRLGFLGFLHMDVFKQRLEQEYDTSVIITTPSVPYRAVLKGQEGKQVEILNPLELPGPSEVEEYLEPYVLGTIIFPEEYMGKMITLCQNRRGEQDDVLYIDDNRVMVKYLLPLSEIIIDFYDELKSLSSGYASFDYEEYGYLQTDIHKMDILINGKSVDALSSIVHKDKASSKARNLCISLRDVIPRQLFEVVIQASIRGKIIARESIRPLRKDVTAKCYGGDMSRKRKLLERQKEGKRKMKRIGKVDLPHEAFLTLMKR